MGTLNDVLTKHSIALESVVRKSAQLEARGALGRRLASKRRLKQRSEEKDKSFAELNLSKPKLGRGVSTQQLEAALRDEPSTRKVRTKIARAVNALMLRKDQSCLNAAELFGSVAIRKGTQPESK